MTAPQAGQLNRRVAIQISTVAADGTGAVTWADFYTCWASLRAATGKDIYAASGFVTQVSHVVTIRYTATPITAGMRVSYAGRCFRIQAAADPDAGQKQLQIFCLED